MNPAIIRPAIDKIGWQFMIFNLRMATALGEGKLNSKILNSTENILPSQLVL